MRKTFPQIKRIGITILSILLFSQISKAATFTALTSGDWSSSTTWGGTVPSASVSSDAIIVPSGITVNLDQDVTLSGLTASLTVAGTVSGSATNKLVIAAGSLSGAGAINTGNVAFGAGAVVTFTGTITTDNFGSGALSLKTAAKIIVNKNMALAAGVLSIESGGTLTLAKDVTLLMAGGTLAVNSGILVLTSTYNVEYDAATTTGAELSGSGLNNITLNVFGNGSIALSGDLTIKGMLTLTAGTLDLNSHNLTLTGDVAAGGTGTITTSSVSDININTSNNLTGSLNFTGTSNAVHNLAVTVGTSNHAQINGTLTVTGALSLNSGMLMLGTGSSLMINGDITASGSGSISASPTANISVGTASSPAGGLSFASGGNAINNLTINIGNGGNLTMGTNLTVNGIVALTKGHINIGSNNLMIGSSGSITGASSANYIMTGANGFLVMSLSSTASAATTFPVGTTANYYPATAKLNSGSTSGNVMVNVTPHVYGQGTTGTLISDNQGVVDATWDYRTDIATNLNMNIGVMWAASTEVHNFDRTHAYISHYTNGNWDATAAASATASGSMYGETRDNITSLSPFAVFDQNTQAGVETAGNTVADNAFGLYPNPVNDQIFISANTGSHSTIIEISNLNGQLIASYNMNGNNMTIPVNGLKDGCYFIKMNDGKTISTKKFIKM